MMQGQCVQKVQKESGEYYKQVLNGIWEENDELWEFFQEGPSSKRSTTTLMCACV